MVANQENLVPNSERTSEERKKIAIAGGIASGKARREKKAMRETLEYLLAIPLKDGKKAGLDSIKNLASVKGKNISVQEAVMLAQIQKAIKGDTRAVEFLRDTAGENPTTKIEAGLDMDLNININYGDDEE